MIPFQSSFPRDLALDAGFDRSVLVRFSNGRSSTSLANCQQTDRETTTNSWAADFLRQSRTKENFGFDFRILL